MVKVTSEVEGDDHVLCASQRLMVRHVLYTKALKRLLRLLQHLPNNKRCVKQTMSYSVVQITCFENGKRIQI